jgi:hypothetical protein
MSSEKYNFKIIFDKLEEATDTKEIRLEPENISELDEIRALREIIIEMQTPSQKYLTST